MRATITATGERLPAICAVETEIELAGEIQDAERELDRNVLCICFSELWHHPPENVDVRFSDECPTCRERTFEIEAPDGPEYCTNPNCPENPEYETREETAYHGQ